MSFTIASNSFRDGDLPAERFYSVRNVSRPMSMIVKAQGPRGRAKIHSDGPNHALGLAQYLRTIGYHAWIEDTSGNDIDDKALKNAIRSHHEDTPSS